MVLPCRRKFGNGAHRPEVVANVIAIAVIEPVRVGVVQTTAGDLAVRRGKISRVVERAKGVFARLRVAGLLVIHGIDRGPTGGIAGQAGAGTAAPAIGGSLLINRP